MRDIRFRAWDKHTGHWVEDITLILHTSGKLIRHPPNVELQQFTGIRAQNGKEIYEGDIVHNVAYTFNGVVFFENGSFWVREYLSHVDEGLYDDREKETRWSIDLEWEVIGNIYENPDLIKAS